MDDTALWLGTGLNWPDALAAGPAVGVLGQSFMLVNGEDLDSSPDTRALLEAKRDVITQVHLLGGHAAISAEVEAAIRAILEGPAAEPAMAPTSSQQRIPPLSGDALLILLAGVALPLAALAGRRRRALA